MWGLLFSAFFHIHCRSVNRWRHIDDGLAIAEFQTKKGLPFERETLFIIKIDPDIYKFTLLSTSELGGSALTTQQWSRKYSLIGAVNAGMYQTDMTSNVGYMKNFDHVNNGHLNSSHKSLAVFNPRHKYSPSFFIHDLDDINVDSILTQYNTAIQNLRLIKRPGENRWQQQSEKWSEAALGQDDDGNVLLIYSSRPVTMHDFNNALLRLPINIACAQHLDGGPHASLYFSHQNVTYNFHGAVTIDRESETIIHGIPLPNVIGFRKRRIGEPIGEARSANVGSYLADELK